jgi:hypothetical protein
MVANTVFVINSNNCQTKRRQLIGSIIVCMTLFLISGVVVSSVDASRGGNTQGLGDAVNTQKPDVKPPDTGTAEYSCPPDSNKCSCDSVTDCFTMGKDGVCKSGTVKPDGSGGATCTRKT